MLAKIFALSGAIIKHNPTSNENEVKNRMVLNRVIEDSTKILEQWSNSKGNFLKILDCFIEDILIETNEVMIVENTDPKNISFIKAVVDTSTMQCVNKVTIVRKVLSAFISCFN